MAKLITEHRVRGLKPKATRYRITDNGLQIEVNPSGRRVWYAQIRAGGQKVRKHLGEYPKMSTRDAREAVRKLKVARAEGERIVDDPSTFETFVEGRFKTWALNERKQGEETMKRIRHTHMETFGPKKLREISQEDIEKHKASLLKGTYKVPADAKSQPVAKAPATVKRDLGDLRRIFSKAIEWELIRKSPASKVSDPKVETGEKLYLDADELEQLEAALTEWEQRAKEEAAVFFAKHKRLPQRPAHNSELPLLVRVLVNTGMRITEALSLEWRDVQFNGGKPTITVRPEVAKSGKRRVLTINAKLSQELLTDFHTLFHVGVPQAQRQRVFKIQNQNKAWLRLRKQARLERVTFHTLRHHVATTLARRGAPPHTVQQVLGHKSLETTMIYFSTRLDDIREALDTL